MIDAQTARAAKDELREQIRLNPHVVGIGLAVSDGDYVVKVNLSEEDDTLPNQIGPVSVITEVVGVIRPRAANPESA